MRSRFSWLAGLAVLGASLTARANTFDTYGFDPRGISLGGAQAADARDFTAAYYNPARLALASKINTGVSFTFARASVDVTSKDPARPVEGLKPEDSMSYALGFVYPFGGKVQDKVAIGLAISMPVRNLLKVQGVDPSKPHWYLYQSSLDRIQIHAGLGVRPLEWLLIGVGAQMLSDFAGDVHFEIDLFNKNFKRRDLVNELNTRVAPTAGISAIPMKGLEFGFTYRSPMQLDFRLPNYIDMGDIGTLFLDVKGVSFYTPHEFVLGGKWDLPMLPELTVTADVEYAMWSKAPNPASSVTVRLGGDLVDGLGLGKAFALDSADQSPGFEDILIPRIGAEYRVGERFAIRGGYVLRPTMTPRQNGMTNLLDCTTHQASVGLGVNFVDPLEILADPVQVNVAFQRGFMVGREAEKSATNEVGPYSYGGATTLFSGNVRFEF